MALRIDSSTQPRPFIPESISTERPSQNFSKALSETSKHRELADFLVRLDNISNKLVKSQSLKDVQEFLGTVKSFLRSTFGQSSKMQEETFWDMHGRHKMLAKVVKINSALDELGQQFIDNHPKPLDVLTKIDQIRGLIVDLFA